MYKAWIVRGQKLLDGVANSRMITPHIKYPVTCEGIQVTSAVLIPEIGSYRARITPIETDGSQYLGELRIDVL